MHDDSLGDAATIVLQDDVAVGDHITVRMDDRARPQPGGQERLAGLRILHDLIRIDASAVTFEDGGRNHLGGAHAHDRRCDPGEHIGVTRAGSRPIDGAGISLEGDAGESHGRQEDKRGEMTEHDSPTLADRPPKASDLSGPS